MPTVEQALAFLGDAEGVNADTLAAARELLADPDLRLLHGETARLEDSVAALEARSAEIALARTTIRALAAATASSVRQAVVYRELLANLRALRAGREHAGEHPGN